MTVVRRHTARPKRIWFRVWRKGALQLLLVWHQGMMAGGTLEGM